jgi:hypothetical protein
MEHLNDGNLNFGTIFWTYFGCTCGRLGIHLEQVSPASHRPDHDRWSLGAYVVLLKVCFYRRIWCILEVRLFSEAIDLAYIVYNQRFANLEMVFEYGKINMAYWMVHRL